MRKFIIYSQTASTSPKIKDLRSAGRWDILLHSIISALFASNTFRTDVILELILMGPPNAPKHIKIFFEEGNTISKKDLKKLIEMCLKKSKLGKVIKVHPGVYVDDLKINVVIENEVKEGRKVFMLDFNGKHIKDILYNWKEYGYSKKDFENATFILGDYDGFDKTVRKFLKKNTERISLGNQMYFTSQAITIINYELDNLDIYFD
jgi:tRNA pseudouridine-54 N-methylase